MLDLSGKVALVTGASSGIGLATAEALLRTGARVALVARRKALLDAHVARLGAERAAAFALDVTDLDALVELPARVAGALGGLDILINNAGLNHRGPILRHAPAALGDVITTNLTAPIVLTRAAAPLLRAGGAIVNVASIAGMVPVPHEAAYSASKAGLRAFTRSLAEELPELTVASVCPGPVDTGFFGDLADVPDIVFSQPMSSVDDVARAILDCIARGTPEIALPRRSGVLATAGYLFPGLARKFRRSLEKKGAREKDRYARKRGETREG